TSITSTRSPSAARTSPATSDRRTPGATCGRAPSLRPSRGGGDQPNGERFRDDRPSHGDGAAGGFPALAASRLQPSELEYADLAGVVVWGPRCAHAITVPTTRWARTRLWDAATSQQQVSLASRRLVPVRSVVD